MRVVDVDRVHPEVVAQRPLHPGDRERVDPERGRFAVDIPAGATVNDLPLTGFAGRYLSGRRLITAIAVPAPSST